ncbi:unnamed protein product [Mucor hiemalis]
MDTGQGVDIIIPPSILEKAQGLAIFTVLKAGFLFSGRAGSGLVVARLPDDSWSAPSAIVTGGMGAGGQIGAELTDFVLVLNTKEAVKTFSHFGNVQLGGNVSIAAGPVGRNAEASGSATFKHVSAIYSYSKTRGLFAGVSLEGTLVITRNDANEKLYGQRFTAKELLNGTVPPPREADSLYRALNAKCKTFSNIGATYQRNNEGEGSSQLFRSSTISAPGTLKIPPPRLAIAGYSAPQLIGPPPTAPQLSNAPLQRPPAYSTPPTTDNESYYSPSAPKQPISPFSSSSSNYTFDSKTTVAVTPQFNKPNQFDDPPTPATVSPPLFEGQRMSFSRDIKYATSPLPSIPKIQQARALYAFKSEQAGDLAFEGGELIQIVQKTDKQNDWWTGRLRGVTGTFPANYVELL